MRAIALWFSVVVGLACGSPVKFAGASVPVQSWSEIAQRGIPCIVNIWVEKTFRADDSSGRRAVEDLFWFGLRC